MSSRPPRQDEFVVANVASSFHTLYTLKLGVNDLDHCTYPFVDPFSRGDCLYYLLVLLLLLLLQLLFRPGSMDVDGMYWPTWLDFNFKWLLEVPL